MEKVITTFIGELKRQLDGWAHDAMAHPNPEPFEHGRAVGTYQGLNQALKTLESVMAEAD